MQAPTSLSEYIKRRQEREQPKVVPFRQPRWIERMQAGKLPAKDFTRPSGDAA